MVELLHTLREGNASADVLDKLGANQREKFRLLQSPPAALGIWLLVDASGITHLRG